MENISEKGAESATKSSPAKKIIEIGEDRSIWRHMLRRQMQSFRPIKYYLSCNINMSFGLIWVLKCPVPKVCRSLDLRKQINLERNILQFYLLSGDLDLRGASLTIFLLPLWPYRSISPGGLCCWFSPLLLWHCTG